jgi:hypothetical protein
LASSVTSACPCRLPEGLPDCQRPTDRPVPLAFRASAEGTGTIDRTSVHASNFARARIHAHAHAFSTTTNVDTDEDTSVWVLFARPERDGTVCKLLLPGGRVLPGMGDPPTRAQAERCRRGRTLSRAGEAETRQQHSTRQEQSRPERGRGVQGRGYLGRSCPGHRAAGLQALRRLPPEPLQG